MPELPEVEVIKKELQPAVTGKVFSNPRLVFPGSVRFPSPYEFARRLPECRVEGLQRKGKYLIFDLSRGIMLIHLRMTGQLLYTDGRQASSNHPYLRVEMPFDDHSAILYCDKRKLGGIWLGRFSPDLPPGFLNLGPDIYTQVDRERFAGLLADHSRAMIKPLLLNQRVFSGLGNIYTDESLFLSFIHPCRRTGTLSLAETDALYGAICQSIGKGIELGGASIRDFRSSGNQEGGFQNCLQVYGRKGKPCNRCGTPVVRIIVGGRGTYFCPGCQKEQRR